MDVVGQYGGILHARDVNLTGRKSHVTADLDPGVNGRFWRAQGGGQPAGLRREAAGRDWLHLAGSSPVGLGPFWYASCRSARPVSRLKAGIGGLRTPSQERTLITVRHRRQRAQPDLCEPLRASLKQAKY